MIYNIEIKLHDGFYIVTTTFGVVGYEDYLCLVYKGKIYKTYINRQTPSRDLVFASYKYIPQDKVIAIKKRIFSMYDHNIYNIQGNIKRPFLWKSIGGINIWKLANPKIGNKCFITNPDNFILSGEICNIYKSNRYPDITIFKSGSHYFNSLNFYIL